MAASNAVLQLRGDPLPPDVQVIRFDSQEQISRPYEITCEFSTSDPSFRVDTCLRQRLLLGLIDGRQGERHLDGVVDRAEFAYLTGTRFHFRVRLRPSLASLAHREDCRIYQKKSAVDVVKEVFAAAGIDRTEWQLQATYDPRELIVQYGESELNFVQRLLEEEGIFYFFRHTPDGHVLVLADAPAAFVPSKDAPEVAFAMGQGFGGEPLSDFTRTRALRTTAVHLRDYDFEKPQQKPESQLPAKDAWPMQHYEYPGGFAKGATGARLAKARISQLRHDADVLRGTSAAIGLRCGVPFRVEGAAQGCLNGEFVVTELRTSGEQTLESGGDNSSCTNTFSAIPAGAPFAAPRVATKPRIHGIQTATVTGPQQDDQAIHVDNYGRVKVRFHWDRVSQQDDTSSAWLRVSQLPMGGSMILPRVGWEVSVAFFNGDPDQPFVIGRLFNAEKTPHYALPGAKTSGALKSMSSPGGAGHNEIKMGDSGGSQGFGMHASKDLNTTVGNDKNETIAVDETHSVTVNMAVSVGSNETLDVGGNQSVDVGAVLSQKIGGSQSITVGGNETANATANHVEKVGGDRSYSVGGDMTVISNTVKQTITGDLSRTVGSIQVNASVGSISDNILGSYTEHVGAVKIELMVGVSSETVGTTKSLTSTAAALHLVTGDMNTQASSITHLIGGLHYQVIGEDYSVKAPIIALVGAIGDFKGGAGNLKLGGGPVVLKGSKIAIKTALLVHLGASMKLG